MTKHRKQQDLETLFGLGPKSSQWLREAGITTPARLRALGPVKAYLRTIQAGASPNLNLLWGLYSAVHDIHWSWISDEEKAALKQELAQLQAPRRAQ